MFVDLKIYILQFVVVVIGSNAGSNVMFMRNMRLDFEKFYKNPQKTLLVGEILPTVIEAKPCFLHWFQFSLWVPVRLFIYRAICMQTYTVPSPATRLSIPSLLHSGF